MNLSRILSDGAAAHGDRPALWFDGRPISYSELDGAARAAERALADRGVGPGDRVAVKLPNSPAYVAVLFGALRRGAIVVPLNVLLAPPEIEERVAAATPVTLVDEDLPGDVEPTGEAALRAGSDPAVVLYTSGTSGRPKGAILTHGGILAAARNAAGALALGPQDVVLGAAPFSHVLGLSTGIVSTLLAGAAVSIVGRFEPEQTLATMTETGTTVLLGVPTMCIALCQAARGARELPPVRIAHVGGAAVPEGVARDFEQTFGGRVVEGYGLTELSGIATTFPVGRPRKPGSVGVPLGGTELVIRDADGQGVGEVMFRGPSVIPGYWNDAEATAEAIDGHGWLATGDMGRVDDEGDLYLVDRKNELIIRGGYNVYPREVEEALYAHPDVLEAAVVGVPDAMLGEEVAALVVRRPGGVVTADQLEAWSRARIARYKVPRRIVFVRDLPRGPTGKLLKREIDRSVLTAGGD